MTLRQWTALIAIAGVLAHGILLVRHHAMAMDATAASAALAELAAALGDHHPDICGAGAGDTEDPEAPRGLSTCPICLGWASALAVLPEPAAAVTAPAGRVLTRVAFQDQRRAALLRLRPPARGPPLGA